MGVLAPLAQLEKIVRRSPPPLQADYLLFPYLLATPAPGPVRRGSARNRASQRRGSVRRAPRKQWAPFGNCNRSGTRWL
jgi:hypothetical protein